MSEALRSERPVTLPQSPDLNRTDNALIWLAGVQVHSFGVLLSLSALTRQPDYGLVLGDGDRHRWAEDFAPIRFGVDRAGFRGGARYGIET